MLTIVIPTYNEKDNIDLLVERIDNVLKNIDYDILFVDDSSDDTYKYVKEKYEGKNIHIIHRENEKGLATAVLLGFREAKGEILACMDADLQHPPEVLKEMYEAMIKEDADVVIPSRLISGGSTGGLNWYRKFVSSTARNIGKFLLKSLRNISDPTGGYFMIKKFILDGAVLKPTGWKILIEVLATTKYNKVVEIPYEFMERYKGTSKLDKDATMQYLKQCIDLRKREVNHDNTIYKVLG